jgi:uncharacterized protein YqgC (DUF456 family)
MLQRIRGGLLPLLAAIVIAVCGALLTGCGSDEPAEEEPAATISADEVPVVREDGTVEGGDAPEDAKEPPAEDQPEEAPEETEAGAEVDAAAEEVPAAEQPVADEPVDGPAADETPGFWAGLWSLLKTIGSFLGKLIFVLILPAAIAGTLLGMPGGVLVLADAIAFSAFHDWTVPPWWVLLILLAIAVLAEAAENVLSFAGVKRSGASNTTGVWVMVGGFAGAIVGGAIAPLLSTVGALAGPVGWVILSIIPPIGFGMLGGFLGGYLFEVNRGKDPDEAKQAGWGALMGRLAGSFTKAMLVAVMAAVVLISTWGALF